MTSFSIRCQLSNVTILSVLGVKSKLNFVKKTEISVEYCNDIAFILQSDTIWYWNLSTLSVKEKEIFFPNYLHFPVKYSIFALSINHRFIFWIRSSMDRISDSGSDDMGSIPVGSTRKKSAWSRLFLFGKELSDCWRMADGICSRLSDRRIKKAREQTAGHQGPEKPPSMTVCPVPDIRYAKSTPPADKLCFMGFEFLRF